MTFAKHWALQAAICKAINIDPSQTTRVVLDLAADGPTRVRVSMYLSAEQQDALIRVFEASAFREVA